MLHNSEEIDMPPETEHKMAHNLLILFKFDDRAS
jgi:hypothetical protein